MRWTVYSQPLLVAVDAWGPLTWLNISSKPQERSLANMVLVMPVRQHGTVSHHIFSGARQHVDRLAWHLQAPALIASGPTERIACQKQANSTSKCKRCSKNRKYIAPIVKNNELIPQQQISLLCSLFPVTKETQLCMFIIWLCLEYGNPYCNFGPSSMGRSTIGVLQPCTGKATEVDGSVSWSDITVFQLSHFSGNI